MKGLEKWAQFGIKKLLHRKSFSGAPTGIRTPVLALKGLRPGPLDDGGGHAVKTSAGEF
jgi:hypothetical protein